MSAPSQTKAVSSTLFEDIPGAAKAIDDLIEKGLVSRNYEGKIRLQDHPGVKALLAIQRSMPRGIAQSVFTRLLALVEVSEKPAMRKWFRNGEIADAAVDAAADFPLNRTLNFPTKAFARRVQEVADLRYEGKFT